MLPNWLYGKSLKKLQEILNSGGQTAANVSYSNTESGLEATNAQTAIDELASDIADLAAIKTGALTGDMTFSSNEIIKKNGVVTINAAFQADKDYAGFSEFANIPSEFRTINTRPMGLLFNDTQGTVISATAFPVGKVQASNTITMGEHYRLAMTYIIA